MIKVISVIFALSLLTACASNPTQIEPDREYSVGQISTEMQFQREVHRLVENLNAGNGKNIFSHFTPLKKEHVVASRMASKRHEVILQTKVGAIKKGLDNTLQGLFYEQDLAIVDIDHDQQSVTLRSHFTGLYPFLWRFDFDLVDGQYNLENIEDLTLNVSNIALLSDSFDYVLQKASVEKPHKSADKRTFFFNQVTRDLEMENHDIKLLTPEVVLAAFNLSTEQDALTLEQANAMAAYIKEHKAESLHAFQLQIDIYFENNSSALKQVEALAPRLSKLDPVGLEVARATYLIRNHRLPEAAAAARLAMDRETLNPWPYALSRRIAKESNNKPLLDVVNEAIKANFNDDLKSLDAII